MIPVARVIKCNKGCSHRRPDDGGVDLTDIGCANFLENSIQPKIRRIQC